MKEIVKFLKSLRVYLYNSLFNKIPFAVIRIFFARFYLRIGNHSNLMSNTIILSKKISNEQIVVGNNCVINSLCILDGRGGKIIINDNVDISMGTWIFTLEHDPHSNNHSVKGGDVIIESNVWIASRVTILPGVTIGEGAVIASGALINKDVKPYTIVGGVPAKELGIRKSNCDYKLNFFPHLDVL